ncbi:MAG TPA: FAD-linked oxidase C-terminal domain-containing protein [Verrucomicrobiae bacterium]|nr:FAD-linked oxidase C-terminal domain-containing protein [Verrucomicrobiae bacterium]
MHTQKPPPEFIRDEPRNHWHGDAKNLERKLNENISGEVRFDAGSRALYSTDGSNYRQIPIGVVLPKSVDDVLQTVALAREFNAPILSRGGGTSLAGQCCNVAVVMDFSKYLNQIVEMNPPEKFAWVRPGIVLDDFRAAAEKFHLTFGPDPATHSRCTVGGMIGNNSCGVHSVMAGKTVENIEELEILTYDGVRMRVSKTSEEEFEKIIRAGGRQAEIYRDLKNLRDKYAGLIRQKFPKIPRRVSGYNLDELLPENGFNIARSLVGAEGTCVTILQAKTRLVSSPPCRCLVVLGYADVYAAGDHVPEVLLHKPIGLEGFDDILIASMRKKNLHVGNLELLPGGNGWLLVEFGGQTPEEAADKARRLAAEMKKNSAVVSAKVYENLLEQGKIWEIRESGLGATAIVPGQPPTWEGCEDAAVPPEKVGKYLRDFRKLVEKFGYHCALYGHFGDGCVHNRVDFDLQSKAGIEHYKKFAREAAHLVVSYGGSLSGEHGDGQSRAELLPIMFGEELIQAFREFKRIWDPQNKMNPGKVIDAYRIEENLRLGENYHPWKPETNFFFAEDENDFSETTMRCVGVGKCRRGDGGTMCPSYMVTREEMHSTRGRSRLLFEMLQGEVIRDGWRSEEVREALELCLACKGCQSDCPVNVDMATYKAEFFSHYYEGRMRPRHAYAMGLIHIWARLASKMPRLANFFGRAPIISNLMKWAVGISQHRKVPQFALKTFRAEWKNHRSPGDGKPVLLWADTFCEHFHPEILRAAVEVLEATGYQVVLQPEKLCCGRPLYDFGMLKRARKMLGEILVTMRNEIRSGIPIVGLEPSCVAVFRDELKRLFPRDEDAIRLSQNVFTLSEFLMKEKIELPKSSGKAIVHGHCHQKAVMKMDAEKALYQRLGLDCDILDSGCCGMAGSFGFQHEHYDISVQCGERSLLPLVREMKDDVLVVADGFSCREQIEQLAGKRALHTAEVLAKILRDGKGKRG